MKLFFLFVCCFFLIDICASPIAMHDFKRFSKRQKPVAYTLCTTSTENWKKNVFFSSFNWKTSSMQVVVVVTRSCLLMFDCHLLYSGLRNQVYFSFHCNEQQSSGEEHTHTQLAKVQWAWNVNTQTHTHIIIKY